MSQEFFDKEYKEHVMQAIQRNQPIRVGSASGCDLFVIQLCKEHSYFNVTVYVPTEQEDVDLSAFQGFEQRMIPGGFKKRDRAMWRNCKQAFACLSQYGGAASGAAATLIACAANAGSLGKIPITSTTQENGYVLDGYAIVELLRKYTTDFDSQVQKLVHQIEENKSQEED